MDGSTYEEIAAARGICDANDDGIKDKFSANIRRYIPMYITFCMIVTATQGSYILESQNIKGLLTMQIRWGVNIVSSQGDKRRASECIRLCSHEVVLESTPI